MENQSNNNKNYKNLITNIHSNIDSIKNKLMKYEDVYKYLNSISEIKSIDKKQIEETSKISCFNDKIECLNGIVSEYKRENNMLVDKIKIIEEELCLFIKKDCDNKEEIVRLKNELKKIENLYNKKMRNKLEVEFQVDIQVLGNDKSIYEYDTYAHHQNDQQDYDYDDNNDIYVCDNETNKKYIKNEYMNSIKSLISMKSLKSSKSNNKSNILYNNSYNNRKIDLFENFSYKNSENRKINNERLLDNTIDYIANYGFNKRKEKFISKLNKND